MAKEQYTVSDGKLVLTLTAMKEGGYMVRSPMDPEILTSAKTLGEAFTKAYDVRKALIASRRTAQRQLQRAAG